MTNPNAHAASVPEVRAALQELHPDPFVQVAILRLYDEAPGLLEPTTFVFIAAAHGQSVERIAEVREKGTWA